MLLDSLQRIVKDQELCLSGDLIERSKELPKIDLVLVITGIRRCGKSTLLKLLINNEGNIGYVNFEDPRLNLFALDDFQKLESIFNEINIHSFCFDEIQNVPGWEKYVRSAHDRGKKVYITGSNASLLSRELGSRLTGRHLQIELFPFSYHEFVNYTKTEFNADSLIVYLHKGGFPEYLKNESKEYLQTLFRDIILRDIVVRRKIRNEKQILDLGIYLISNTAKLFSFNKLTKLLEIKSVRTTIDYCDYLQDAYIFQFVPRYSFSVKKQINNQKKVYCIDNGLITASTLSFSKDLGRMLENLIFQQLRRIYTNIYYHKEKYECDFLVKNGLEIIQAIQVCWVLNDENQSREIGGLKEALSIHKNAKGVIITFDQEDVSDGIELIPVWKWLQSTY